MISVNILIKLENVSLAAKGRDELLKGRSHLTSLKDFTLIIIEAVRAHRDDAPQINSDATQIVAQYSLSLTKSTTGQRLASVSSEPETLRLIHAQHCF